MATEEATPLDQILSGEPNEAPATMPEPEEPQEAASQPRDESGRFAKKGEEESASPAPANEQDDPPFDHAAVKGERTRRQAAEQERDSFRAELDALKQQFQQLQQPKEPPAPPPSMWEDEQGWQQHFGGQLVSQAVQQSTMQSRLTMSEMMVAQQHEDFGSLRDQIFEFVGANPAINQQVAESQHPWNTAYLAFKNQQTMQELGAVNVADLEAKLREKIMAELQQGQSAVPQAQATLPPTLTGERNVGSRSGPAWSGPTPLSQMLA